MFYLNISSTDFFNEKQIAKPLHFEEIYLHAKNSLKSYCITFNRDCQDNMYAE